MREVFFLLLCLAPPPLRTNNSTPSSSATSGLSAFLTHAQPEENAKCYEFKNPPLRTYCALSGLYYFSADDVEKKCKKYFRANIPSSRTTDLSRSCILMKIFSLRALFLGDGAEGTKLLQLDHCTPKVIYGDTTRDPKNFIFSGTEAVCEVNLFHSGGSSCVTVEEDYHEVVHCYFKEEVSAHESRLRCGNRGSDMDASIITTKFYNDSGKAWWLAEKEFWVDCREENIRDCNNSCVTASMVGLASRFFKRSCSNLYPAFCQAKGFPDKDLRFFPPTNFSMAAANCKRQNKTLFGNKMGFNKLWNIIKKLKSLYATFVIWDGGFNPENGDVQCPAVNWIKLEHVSHDCSDAVGYTCSRNNSINVIWPPENENLYCGNLNRTNESWRQTRLEPWYLTHEEGVAACRQYGMTVLPGTLEMLEYETLLEDYKANSYPDQVYSYWLNTSKSDGGQCALLLGYDNQYTHYEMNCSARLRTVCVGSQERSSSEACGKFPTCTSCLRQVSENVATLWRELREAKSLQDIVHGLSYLDGNVTVPADIQTMPYFLGLILNKIDTLNINRTSAQRAEATHNLANCTVDLADKTMQKGEVWKKINREHRLNTVGGLLKTVEDFVIKMVDNQDRSFVKSSLGSGNLKVEVMQLRCDDLANGIGLVGDSGSRVNLSSTSETRDHEYVSVIFSENLLAKELLTGPTSPSAEASSGSSVLLTPLVTASLVVNGTRVTNIPNGTVKLFFPYEYPGIMGQLMCSFIMTNENNFSEWSAEGCTAGEVTDGTVVCSCNHLTIFAILMSPTDLKGEVEVLVRITQIGCGISIVCLIACVVVFTACRRLRGISNTIHRNLCLCLLIAEILLLVGMKKNDENEVRCTIMAFSLHFLFLSAFGWMALEGCHIIVLLWKVFNQRRSYYERYYLAGYGIPLMIASITLGSQYHSYSPKSGAYCWLPEEKGMRYSFIGPVAAVIFLNLGALLLVLWKMSQTQLLVDKSTAEKVKSWLRGTFILLPILGITWLLGFLMLGSNSLYKTGAYIFTIFNSFQGLGIFVCHVLLNQKTRREVLKTFSSMLSNSESFRSTGLSSTSTTNTELFTSSSSNLTTTRRIRQGRERFLQTLEELGNVSRPRRWWQGAFRYNLKVSDANDRST